MRSVLHLRLETYCVSPAGTRFPMFRQSNIHLLDFSFVSLLTFLDDFIKCLKAVFYVEARFDNDG